MTKKRFVDKPLDRSMIRSIEIGAICCRILVKFIIWISFNKVVSAMNLDLSLWLRFFVKAMCGWISCRFFEWITTYISIENSSSGYQWSRCELIDLFLKVKNTGKNS